ncbi:hypothetical protein DSO57_1018156 [Entomophthora muscae]|uniref:Uncharacterized protein n=1 Tax=Entomophthora muscae TaxID=34485 RepID=A0ACC2ST63_9FUNG|nr:hypothetical protein DSO57_1018156 [Entomophthora muscae]
MVTATPPLESSLNLGTSGVSSPSLQDNAKPLDSNSPNHKPEKTTTRYELKRIKSPMNQLLAANTLCILDAPDEDHHAATTYLLDGCSCNKPNALPQKPSALNCLSSMTLEGHGESLNYASDNSSLSLCFSSDDDSPDGVPVDRNNPYFTTGLTICQYLGAMTLSPASRIESLLGPRSPNPTSPNGHASPNPSLISLDSTNKEFSGYFLLSVDFLGCTGIPKTLTLLDTGAKVNFISIKLASELGLNLHPRDLVKGGNSVAFDP